MIEMRNVLCIFNLLLLCTRTSNERIYPLITDLEPLLQTQKQVIVDLDRSIISMKKIYGFIRREHLRYKAEHNKLRADVKLYLENKINRFTLYRRLTHNLDYMNNITTQETSLIRNETLKYPSSDDLEESARMITRLQQVYLLNVTQLADGLLQTHLSRDGTNFTETFLPMTTSDCYEIGKALYNLNWFKNGIQWFVEAYRLCKQEKKSQVDILNIISKGYHELNNSAQYVVWTQRLLELKPDFDENTITHLKVMVDIHQLRINEANMRKISKQGKTNIKKKKKLSKKYKQRKIFRSLCRNELVVPHDVSKSLKCWYFKGHHQFSSLARFKAEQLFIQPNILLIHDAISDAEIKTIKDIALPQLEIAPIVNTNNRTTMHLNPSKKMSFNHLQSQSVNQLTHRVSDMTGLLAELEALMVTNYGVGGYYVPHLDSAGLMEEKELIKILKSENNLKRVNKKSLNDYNKEMSQIFRIASVLFYLTDVEQGGATVFPLLGLSVFPVKGAALMWTNLLPTGKSDLLTIHGACPVLRGSKWVATKWIDGANQELRKPCFKNYKRQSKYPAYLPEIYIE